LQRGRLQWDRVSRRRANRGIHILRDDIMSFETVRINEGLENQNRRSGEMKARDVQVNVTFTAMTSPEPRPLKSRATEPSGVTRVRRAGPARVSGSRRWCSTFTVRPEALIMDRPGTPFKVIAAAVATRRKCWKKRRDESTVKAPRPVIVRLVVEVASTAVTFAAPTTTSVNPVIGSVNAWNPKSPVTVTKAADRQLQGRWP